MASEQAPHPQVLHITYLSFLNAPLMPLIIAGKRWSASWGRPKPQRSALQQLPLHPGPSLVLVLESKPGSGPNQQESTADI